MEDNAWVSGSELENTQRSSLGGSTLQRTTLEASPLNLNDDIVTDDSDANGGISPGDPNMSPRYADDGSELYRVDLASFSALKDEEQISAPQGSHADTRSQLPSAFAENSNFTSFLGTSVAPNVLTIRVADPQKHDEGSQAFVSYSITTSTVLDSFSSPELTVQRRFQDLVWLHKQLEEEFPACILPPLPGKHRMEYLTGDRFSAEFIEKRRSALQRYLNRVARHALFYKSEPLRIFLENNDLRQRPLQLAKKHNSLSTLDTLADTVMNAFAKSKSVDPKFVEAKDRADRLEKNLRTVEKYQLKAIKLGQELSEELKQLGQTFAVLAAMEVPITEPALEFVKALYQTSKAITDLSHFEDTQFLGNIEEYIGFAFSMKDTLRKRDEKQAEYEELLAYLSKANAERSETARSGHGPGIRGFIKGKMDEIRGTDIEQKKVTRVEKLNKKVDELNQAVSTSKEEWQLFDKQVLYELEVFEHGRQTELKREIETLINKQISFWEENESIWSKLIPVIEGITIVADEKKFPSTSADM